MLRRLIAKFFISRLKKGIIKSETATRVLVHHTLQEMQRTGKTKIEFEYNEPYVKDSKLIIRCELVKPE